MNSSRFGNISTLATTSDKPALSSTDCQPRISVVIPAFNEEATIAACLASLACQDFVGRVEVIVVDNASTDATADIARAFGARVVSEPVRGVCHARQRGTAAATGDIVVSSDADTTFPPNWLSQIDATMSAQPELVASCGPCSFVDGPWWGAPYTRALFGVTAWFYRRTRRVLYASATNIAFRRCAWTGYDTRLTQGGDELGLLRSLRCRGPVHFDSQRVTLTSSRRLYRGLLYNVFVTCLYFYFGAYFVNRLAGKPLLGAAPAIRPSAVHGGLRSRHSVALVAVVLGALAVALRVLLGDVG
ncbi:MAG: glycosyltransferase family 2 protein [Pseudonocardiales bacterium]|nr:MAG: glycosyltransferase family 2 protein [Pseudonocardiales bacterium]